MKRKYICILVYFLLMVTGCAAQVPDQSLQQTTTTTPELQSENSDNNIKTLDAHKLQKICKVWGFVKYTHPVFISGEKDWDLELFNLLEQSVLSAHEDDNSLNATILSWIVSLGGIEYEQSPEAAAYRMLPDESRRIQADKAWISDKTYLGDTLCLKLEELDGVSITGREKSPAFLENYMFARFTNEKPYPAMDYKSASYRLLGLFRFWNAVEYYFPYRDIMDADWNEALFEAIESMLVSDDEESYLLTLLHLGTYMNDAHVSLTDNTVLLEEFGEYLAPVRLTTVDGQFVVRELYKGHKDTCPLLPGDVIAGLDSKPITDLIDHRLQYLSVPENEKLLRKLAPYLLRSHSEHMELAILRNGKESELRVKGYTALDGDTGLQSYELLEHNIGLINTGELEKDEIHAIMDAFNKTDGLIVDLRQYPNDYIVYSLAEYLLPASAPFVLFSLPNIAAPGEFMLLQPTFNGKDNPNYYKKPIAILMDETSLSQSEYTVMALRNAPNAKVVGGNSAGADGDVVTVPLPGGNSIGFTGLGVYTPDGRQTQRVGLSPDIPVKRTLEGVRAGRDELMEAAIAYILSEN